jgi:predicted membrane protein
MQSTPNKENEKKIGCIWKKILELSRIENDAESKHKFMKMIAISFILAAILLATGVLLLCYKCAAAALTNCSVNIPSYFGSGFISICSLPAILGVVLIFAWYNYFKTNEQRLDTEIKVSDRIGICSILEAAQRTQKTHRSKGPFLGKPRTLNDR